MLIGSFDARTGEQVIREATEAEIAEREAEIALHKAEANAIIEANAEKAAAKAALLERLGITADEAALLLG
jgi:succinyl-CoA synthetase alpha subunit